MYVYMRSLVTWARYGRPGYSIKSDLPAPYDFPPFFFLCDNHHNFLKIKVVHSSFPMLILDGHPANHDASYATCLSPSLHSLDETLTTAYQAQIRHASKCSLFGIPRFFHQLTPYQRGSQSHRPVECDFREFAGMVGPPWRLTPVHSTDISVLTDEQIFPNLPRGLTHLGGRFLGPVGRSFTSGTFLLAEDNATILRRPTARFIKGLNWEKLIKLLSSSFPVPLGK